MANGKTGIVAITAVLLGFLAGTWSGRGSTRTLQEELERTQAELEAAKKKAQSSTPLAFGLQTLLNRRGSEPQVDLDAGSRPSAEATAPPEGGEPVGETAPPRLGGTAADSEERRKAVETVTATWRLRATQARASFIEAADLSTEQQAALQKTVDHLNQEVKAVVEQQMERIDFEKPEVRDMVDLGVALGAVYQDVDDELRQNLNEEQMGKALEAQFDIFSQVDPDIVAPLMLKLDRPQ